MGTVHGTRRKGKRKKRLSEVRVVSGAEYGEMELSGKVELIRQLIPLGLRHVHEELQGNEWGYEYRGYGVRVQRYHCDHTGSLRLDLGRWTRY